MHIPQKGKKLPKNGIKWQKMAENCKISEITKYGEKMTTIDKNTKNGPKTGQIKKKMSSFSGSKLLQKMVLAVFTRCLVPEIQICVHFRITSVFLGPNFSRTEISTAKPMILGYKGQFLRPTKQKSFDPFFRKVQNTA